MDRRNFISTVGKGLFVTAGSGMLASCNRTIVLEYEDQLKAWSLAAFNRFEKVWDFNDFWKRGNTFDACLVFASAVQQRWPDDPEVQKMNATIISMLEQNLEFFKGVKVEMMWADDFGWWGLMALNARKFLIGQGERELANKYWYLSDDLCWQYKMNTAYDHTPDAKPVPHGCRNGDAAGNSLGVKNTVTNVLLFLLSSRIFRVAKAEKRQDTEKYLDMAYRQWVWFSEWFELEEYQYLKKLSTSGVLVQERPIAEFEGSGYTEKIHPPWAEGWVWTGDQGMLVAALTDMIAIKSDLEVYVKKNNLNTAFKVGEFEKQALGIIQGIGTGVKNALVADVDGIIREAPCLSSFGPVHGRDYVAGRGIMMRYLGNTEEKALLNVNLDDELALTVQAIWDTRNKTTNQFQPEFTGEENDKLYVAQFRKLWGFADDVHKWNLNKMVEKNKDGVCQSVGLDMLGAAIKALK